MNATFLQRIELRFWDIFLPMLSESQLLRKTVKTVVTLYQNEHLKKELALGLMIACAGFASGIFIYTLTRIIG
jgi:hypothetical protein